MTARGSFRKYTTAFVAISMLAGSAASAAPRTVDPLVALSVFGTSESRAAVCAAGAQAAAAAGAAMAAQAATGQAGCVLPVMDAAPPPIVTEAAPSSRRGRADGDGRRQQHRRPATSGWRCCHCRVGRDRSETQRQRRQINLPISP